MVEASLLMRMTNCCTSKQILQMKRKEEELDSCGIEEQKK